MNLRISTEVHPKFQDKRILISKKLVSLSSAIKKDISRILWLSQLPQLSQRDNENIQRWKIRIIKRCEEIIQLRETYKMNETDWHNVLTLALHQTHKYENSPQVSEKVKVLLLSDKEDMSPTWVYFIREFLRIIARIPHKDTDIIFHK